MMLEVSKFILKPNKSLADIKKLNRGQVSAFKNAVNNLEQIIRDGYSCDEDCENTDAWEDLPIKPIRIKTHFPRIIMDDEFLAG